MGTIILITVIVVIFYLGRYVLREVQRIEQQKEFFKDMDNFDNKKNK
tara:strand:+ start:591 stop:731 length:141 start_codon:yes stop_codon:yes gene_type:complete